MIKSIVKIGYILLVVLLCLYSLACNASKTTYDADNSQLPEFLFLQIFLGQRDFLAALISLMGVAREQVGLKYRQLMAGFNTLGAFAEAFKTTPPPAVPRPPHNSATVTEGLKEAPSHEEARVLLEKRKEIRPPEEVSNRAEKPRRKRKRGSSTAKAVPTPENPVLVEDDDEASSGSDGPIVDAVPLSTNFPGIKIREPKLNVSGSSSDIASKGKGKQVLVEEEAVYTRNIKARKPGVPFVNLTPAELVSRYNRASRCLVTQDDMDYLDSLNPEERMQKAQSSMAESLIRMMFETSKIQQNEVDQETIRSLTARIDEQDEKVADLKVRLEKCKSLSERLDMAEKWRARLKEILTEASEKLEKNAVLSLEISTDIGNVLEAFDKVSTKSKYLTGLIAEEQAKLEDVLEAAKYYKEKSERRGRIAKDWLSYPDCGSFMAKLSGEMINNGILLEAEATRLAALELGVDPEKLTALAVSKRGEALNNLTAVFNKGSDALNDPEWDAEEQKQWAEKISPDLETRASNLDFTIYLPKAPNPPAVPDRSGFSRIEHRCNDLAGHLTREKETFQELAQELDAREPLTFDLDDLLKLSPSPVPRSPSPVSAANEQAN